MTNTIQALTQGLQQVLGSTLLISLMAAIQLPVVLTKLSYLIDNPWTVSLTRAEAAGLILADSLIDRNLGTRPITFVGYSLGCRMIFSCLRELARKGAYGLVQNVYLFGSPIVAKKDDYLKARSVVSGRFVNGYATNDWILGYLFRLTSGGISRVAGLAAVNDVPGLENVNVTDFVPGHMAYRAAMPRLLREVGWLVEADEFTEIEDPDPENHAQRQRELINEIEEARKEFDRQEREKNGKGKFGFLRKKKKDAVSKKEWEMYKEQKIDEEGAEGSDAGSLRDRHEAVLFDIDAIRAELASENFEVRELQSTLPPLKLDSPAAANREALGARETKSADAVPTIAHPGGGSYTPESVRTSRTFGPVDDAYRGYHASPFLDPQEDEVQMSFDTPSPGRSSLALGYAGGNGGGSGNGGYESPRHPAVEALSHDPWASTSHIRTLEVSPRASGDVGVRDHSGGPGTEAAPPAPPPKDGESSRPGLRTSYTAPPPQPKNAWADEYDDDDEFQEKAEVEMTFA
jgi:hypothetical protein